MSSMLFGIGLPCRLASATRVSIDRIQWYFAMQSSTCMWNFPREVMGDHVCIQLRCVAPPKFGPPPPKPASPASSGTLLCSRASFGQCKGLGSMQTRASAE